MAGNRQAVHSADAFCPITVDNADQVELLATLTNHSDKVWNAVFSPDGTLLASGGEDLMVYLQNVDNLSDVAGLSGNLVYVLGLSFTADGNMLASAGYLGSQLGAIRLWDLSTNTQSGMLLGHADGCWSLDFQESTGHLVSGGRDMLVKVWDPAVPDPIFTLSGHTGWVLSVDFNPVQPLIASSSTDQTVRLWNAETGELVRVLTGHTNNIGYVKFHPSGDMVASSADDYTLRLWDVATGDLIWSRDCGQGWLNGVNFSPDGTVMLTCGHNGTVGLYRTTDGEQLIRLYGHTQPVLRGSFNPAGTMFATASWDSTVKIWGIRPKVNLISQDPAIPAGNDSVCVTAGVSACGQPGDMVLYYDSGSGWIGLPMVDDGQHGDGAAGDETFGAFIPAFSNGSTVQYYLSLADFYGGLSFDPPAAPISVYSYSVGCCGAYTGGFTGNTDCDTNGKMNLADVTKLIDRVYLSKQPLCCEENGNVDGDIDGKFNLADITKLIDHIYLSKQPTAACQ